MNKPKQPEPVMNAAYLASSLIGLVKLILVGLVAFGIWDITNEQQGILVAIVTALVDFVIVAATMYHRARSQVTPLKSPRDNAGAPLVRADGRDPVV